MKKKVNVSRSGLTRCPSCQAHICLAEEVAETACPFCDARLFDDSSRSLVRRALDAVTSGRSGLIATTLAGALAGGGCTTDAATGTNADGFSGDGQTTADGSQMS